MGYFGYSDTNAFYFEGSFSTRGMENVAKLTRARRKIRLLQDGFSARRRCFGGKEEGGSARGIPGRELLLSLLAAPGFLVLFPFLSFISFSPLLFLFPSFLPCSVLFRFGFFFFLPPCPVVSFVRRLLPSYARVPFQIISRFVVLHLVWGGSLLSAFSMYPSFGSFGLTSICFFCFFLVRHFFAPFLPAVF